MKSDLTKLTAAVDFGSTYTKIAAFDLEKEELIGTAQARTTVESDINIGLKQALNQLEKKLRDSNINFHIERFLACSSAAGGLRMIAIGLTKALTTKAAEQAVLGAGAKLVAAYSYKLDENDIKNIEEKAPDLILLAGGTDGGDEKNIIQNAKLLARSRLESPIIIAGNKSAADEVCSTLEKSDKNIFIVENILPELDRINIEPTRNIIREIFINKIIHAKGIDKAREIIGDVIIPTPLAVLKSAELLGKGIDNESGWGNLVLIDVGGATTDVYSIGQGNPSQADIILKGLPEPFAKRTVEGDLGIRYNADSILEKVGAVEIRKQASQYDKKWTAPAAQDGREIFTIDSQDKIEINSYIKYVSKTVEHIAQNDWELLIDLVMAAKAVEIAVQRHAGKIEEIYSPGGKIKVQHGKDLTQFDFVIGAGGILTYNRKPETILKSACFGSSRPESLCPISPQFFVDKYYILFAAGLLSELVPIKALRIIKKYLGIVGIPGK